MAHLSLTMANGLVMRIGNNGEAGAHALVIGVIYDNQTYVGEGLASTVSCTVVHPATRRRGDKPDHQVLTDGGSWFGGG